MKSLTHFKLMLMLLAYAAAFALVGTLDYEDAVREEQHYCEMVGEGYWPDYREIYDEMCKENDNGSD